MNWSGWSGWSVFLNLFSNKGGGVGASPSYLIYQRSNIRLLTQANLTF